MKGPSVPTFAITCLSCHWTGEDSEFPFFAYQEMCDVHGMHDMVSIICPACKNEVGIEQTYPFEAELEEE